MQPHEAFVDNSRGVATESERVYVRVGRADEPVARLRMVATYDAQLKRYGLALRLACATERTSTTQAWTVNADIHVVAGQARMKIRRYGRARTERQQERSCGGEL